MKYYTYLCKKKSKKVASMIWFQNEMPLEIRVNQLAELSTH